MSIWRVRNVIRYVLKFRTLVSCLSTSGDKACCIAVIICLLNPLEGLLMRSYYCICTSCVSFVNAFRHCRVISLQRIAYRPSCAFLSHAMRLWLPPAPNPVEPLRASLCVLSWLGNDKSCSSSGCCGCSRIQNK